MTDLQINIKLLCLSLLFLCSFCKNNLENKGNKNQTVLSNRHEKNLIWCDLNGDKEEDKVEIVVNQTNNKSGLRITFSNSNKIDYFGLGKDVLQRGFDSFDWVGIFEKAPKGETYWNNVNEEGDIKTEKEEFTEADKLVLKNDGIYIHVAEGCGGGIIYLENGVYHWLQQE